MTADQKPGMLEAAAKGKWKTARKKKEFGGDNDSGGYITIGGYPKPQVVSALQKAIRRAKEKEALFWAMELMQSNQSYQMWRRLIVIAAEDVGLADPDMVMRIMLMKQAHDMGREDNIPFLAVMLLCRAPKNREADDASWYYAERRKTGWKIPMPPEAVDGHTPEGKRRLYGIARDTHEDFAQVWNREFYYDAALLRNYQPDTFWGKEDPYRQEMMAFFGLPYRTYDIETCPEPRILTGSGGRTLEDQFVETRAGRVPDKVDKWQDEGQPDVWFVRSFTDPSKVYTVDLSDDSCDCPDWTRNKEAGMTDHVCKHLLAVMRG